jgi:uncharacterized protein
LNILLPLAGGATLGLGAALVLLATGTCAGVSGQLDRVSQLGAPAWRWAFVGGLIAGGLLARLVAPTLVPGLSAGPGTLVVAGLLVGFGARVGGGCTSGHGFIGTSRFSPRSVLATLTFMATGFATVGLARVLHG